jgi:hypothetical protein
VVGEDVPARRVGVGAEALAQTGAVEDVVAEDQRDRLVTDEVRTDQERLGKALGAGLHRIAELDADLGPVTEEPAETVLVLGRGDHQDLADSGIHQQGQRVVDHRLVVDRHQLLADRLGDRVQPRPAASGQNDSAHSLTLTVPAEPPSYPGPALPPVEEHS